ncbi:hypothetical protein BBBOND_0101160 [Babesia bigemina]|uniref:Uncharacterized protein n=1 Tax=Babesia bigemina TaxID=5866 RepID=A0A061D0Y9_BABBI|nr:hypothetical protein BBBOND_0101160 [Babesia bigemina]CDR93787.1 hypothetical protein BBBOND_0101160 [Babesia bigemina]|eukprot:XP_012765973.1 hypothetical protein BBBOND_0101160 [Babesia bigemina]
MDSLLVDKPLNLPDFLLEARSILKQPAPVVASPGRLIRFILFTTMVTRNECFFVRGENLLVTLAFNLSTYASFAGNADGLIAKLKSFIDSESVEVAAGNQAEFMGILPLSGPTVGLIVSLSKPFATDADDPVGASIFGSLFSA